MPDETPANQKPPKKGHLIFSSIVMIAMIALGLFFKEALVPCMAFLAMFLSMIAPNQLLVKSKTLILSIHAAGLLLTVAVLAFVVIETLSANVITERDLVMSLFLVVLLIYAVRYGWKLGLYKPSEKPSSGA